ncbi:MAG: two-component system sensor histidine kinase NtrB [Dissulfurispiraceae bacterium]
MTVSLVLIILTAFVFLLPRLFRKKDSSFKEQEINIFLESIHNLSEEINKLKEQLSLKERLAVLGEVSAGIAHELRTPMSVIAGNAKLLLKSLDLNEGGQEIVMGILNEVREMSHIIDELLKFSTSEPLNKVTIDLSSVISNVVAALDEGGKKINLSLPNKMTVNADETLIKQALKNLIRNALDAGSEVLVALEKGSQSGKEGAVITVSDNGTGIPTEDLARIFTPFYTTKKDGLGIGLPIVQKIVLAHGGNVDVKNNVGKGTRFKIFIPYQ